MLVNAISALSGFNSVASVDVFSDTGTQFLLLQKSVQGFGGKARRKEITRKTEA
jgi:hypothetical protein